MKALAIKNKYFNDHIEEGLNEVEKMIFLSAKNGRDYIKLIPAAESKNVVKVLTHKYPDEFCKAIREKFGIKKEAFSRVVQPWNSIKIEWSQVDE